MADALKISPFARDFLASAKSDLKAARHLYQGGCYPQAVYYLQQCVEKGMKSYSVSSGLINEGEARKEIGHKILRIYEKSVRDLKKRALDEQKKMDNNPVLKAALGNLIPFPRMIKEIDDMLIQVKKLSQHDEKSLHITEEDLNKTIKTLQDLHRDSKRERKNVQTKNQSHLEYRHAKADLSEMIEAMFAGQPEKLQIMKKELDRTFTKDSYEKQMREILLQNLTPMETFGAFFHLSCILQPHAYTRYPKNGFNPLEFYKPDLPLIKSFPKLADITERVLNQVEEMYQDSVGGVQHVPA